MPETQFKNPFRPGAGHMPPHLAGRVAETEEFRRLLKQDTILENLLLTGLRGVGKTVLLETLKPIAMEQHWLWVGTDLSESSSIDEPTIARRLLTDMSPITSRVVIEREEIQAIGFHARPEIAERTLNYDTLEAVFATIPGMVADKLKGVIELVWSQLRKQPIRGVIFAYDEAQTLFNSPGKNQYPLSLLLDVFQSLQRKDIPFMLALTGLPTLFPKLVEARTFAERMFRVVFLNRLSDDASRDAILKPMESADCPIALTNEYINEIIGASAGYPYFIQFVCREVFDAGLQKFDAGEPLTVPMDEIIRKLDADFFAGRWARATDRQRDLLQVIATLDNSDSEFTVQEVVEQSTELLSKPFSSSHVNQMLAALSKAGLVYKNRYGKYSFAVPLFGQFILRQIRGSSSGESTALG